VADGEAGTFFAVWAPNAERVFVMGDFNGWNKTSHPLHSRAQSGIWEAFVPGLGPGTTHKDHIPSRHGHRVDQAGPLPFRAQLPPRTGSVVWDLDYRWSDAEWMRTRRNRNALEAPVSIYEVHLGSWRRVPEQMNRPLTYRELAPM